MNNISYDEQMLLDYLAKGMEYQRYIFNKLIDINKLFLIYKNQYFSFSNNPPPIESEKDKGYFSIPYWPALTYLEKISKECTKPENREYAKALIDILNNVTRPDGDKSKRIDNYRTWQSFVKIMATLPPDIVQLSDIDLVADWLDSKFDTSLVVREIGKTLLPKLLETEKENSEKVRNIIKILVESFKEENRRSHATHGLKEIFKHNAGQLGEKCGKEVSEILKKKIESIITKNDDELCYIWRPAIEEHHQNVREYEYRDILISGLRDILLGYASTQEVTELLKDCFHSEKYIIRRICIYVVDKLFEKQKYSESLEAIFQDKIIELLVQNNYHHEWYLFLKNHFKELSSNLQEIILKTIETLEKDRREDTDKEKVNILVRRKWFYAIKSSGYELPVEIEEKYFKGIDYKPEHPEFLSYIGPVTWDEESIFSAGELLAKGSVENIILFLNEYQGKNRFGELATTEAGQSLKDAIKVKQDLFENNLDEFKKVKWEYKYYVWQAFEELWENDKPINWEKILEYALKLVKNDSVWSTDETEDKSPRHAQKSWIPAVIADLIKSGVQNDERAMPDNCLDKAKQIISVMLEKQKSTATGDSKDSLTEAINTSKGRVLECFLDYVLRRYRIYEKLPDKGEQNKLIFWKEVEPLFNREIDRTNEGNFEFSSIVGQYLPNLYYLNKGWVERNINNIFSEDETHWRCAMQGYSYVTIVYTVIYDLLRSNGHLKKAIETEFDNDQVRRSIINNIIISYLRGTESLKDENGLFRYLLNKWQEKDFEEIINLFWMHRDVNLPTEQKNRILEFWKFCFNHIKGQEEQHKNILSELNNLAVFLDEITDEEKNWLVQSAPYVDEMNNSMDLVEYLDKLADKNAKAVGEIYLVMLSKTIPFYEEENIKSIVEKIYKRGNKDIADQICDKYARNGYDFLTDLYKTHNK